MNRAYLRDVEQISPEKVVGALQTQQHVEPHLCLRRALGKVTVSIGFPLEIAEEAMKSLQLEASRSVGRLRSSELMQLARTMQRIKNRKPAAQGCGSQTV